jgi:hypothetical protein
MFLQFFIWLYRICTHAVDVYTATSFPYAPVSGGSSAVKTRTVPWFRLLFAGLSPQCREFNTRPFNEGFMVDTVAVLPVSLRVLQILSVSVIPLIHRTHYLLVGGSTLSWCGGLSTPVTLRAIPAVACLLAGPPCCTGQRVGIRRRETPKLMPEAASSVAI